MAIDIADIATKFVFASGSIVGSIAQLATTITNRNKSARKTEAQVEPLDGSYGIIIKLPIWLSYTLLILVIVICFATLITGALILGNKTPPSFMRQVFDRWYWFFVAFVAVFLIVHLNWLSLGLLHFTKFLDNLRYRPGWINANWQLTGYKEDFAMNINANRCQNLAAEIYQQIIDGKEVKQQYQAPDPVGLDTDEKANYLLFKCVVESGIYRSDRSDLGMTAVRDSQDYLAWAALTSEHPFQPQKLRDILRHNDSLYGMLKELPGRLDASATAQAGSLPDYLPIEQATQQALKTLVQRFKGQGSRLARGPLSSSPSPEALLRNLGKFENLDGPRGDSMRRLYLKLSIRMNLWPTLRNRLGPFLYPQNNGIAILLLNAGCLVAPDELETVDLSDDNFWALVAEAEDQIVNYCYQWLTTTDAGGQAEKTAFSQTVFKCEPGAIDKFRFSDYVDLWLYGHTSGCRRRKGQKSKAAGQSSATESNPASVPSAGVAEQQCKMLSKRVGCYCEKESPSWYQSGILLKRD